MSSTEDDAFRELVELTEELGLYEDDAFHMTETSEPTAEQITIATVRQHVERMLKLTAAGCDRNSHAAGFDACCRDVLSILDMNGRPAHEPVMFRLRL